MICLFAWDNHEERGGMHDLIGVYPDVDSAKDAFPDGFEGGHIVEWQDVQPVILLHRGCVMDSTIPLDHRGRAALRHVWMTPEEYAKGN